MQLRSSSSSSRESGEHRVHVGAIHHPKLTERRKTEDELEGDLLPFWDSRNGLGKKNSSKWIHGIPLIVLLCIFILWWFSYPVTLRTAEGIPIATHGIDFLLPANFSRIDVSMLTVANSPLPSSLQNSSRNYGYEVQFISTSD